ncbi:MAG: cyclic nucleotide-binding domain-containing protein [Acidimicrobiia bacterium]|nr:cyclic nucleotide-binding domain-containing protein [Acidimicrobiia bacterium]
MQTQPGVDVPQQVLDYLQLHHVITIATASFTGMPHAATTAYVSDGSGLYFSMQPDELTVRNIDANHFASFTIDDYTPDFRKVRELRGVGRSAELKDPDRVNAVLGLFSYKLPNVPRDALTNVLFVRPLELHFVDFEYTEGVAVPLESSIVYEAAPETTAPGAAAMSTQLEPMSFEPGQVIVRQGERSDRFFIIVEGEVEVRREGHGQDVVVTRHAKGQFFGEAGALTGAPQSATFVAVTPTTVLAVDRSALQDFVTQSAAAGLGQRVRATLSDLHKDPAGN